MTAPARERRRMAPEARRAQILDAAFRVFAERGYHAARMDDLVRESGLSKGSLYWHFESKEDVFLALFDALEAEVFAAWDDEETHEHSVLRMVAREGEIVLQRLVAERAALAAWMEFLAHPAARERMQVTYDRSRARLAGLVRRGIDAGELDPALPVPETAALLTGAVEGLVLQACVSPDFDAIGAWRRAWPVLERGIAR
jgi:TetR/AcrR family acrAB operon transcriptional repressor